MDQEGIERVLTDAIAVRYPAIDPNAHPRERVQKLQEHISATAIHRGDLEEALYWAIEASKLIRRGWDGLDGWQIHTQNARTATREQVTEAKRKTSPELYQGLQDSERLKSHLHRQIRRLELDYDAASREYTLIAQ